MRPVTARRRRCRHQPPVETFRHNSLWPVSAVNWSVRCDRRHRVAIGSNLDSMDNYIEILYLESPAGEMHLQRPVLRFDHPSAPTKIMFFPLEDCLQPDLLATSADFLRLWRVADDASRVDLHYLLIGNPDDPFEGPLTSFDWNVDMPRRIGTCSLDTTCKVWDIESQTVEADFVDGNNAVNDIAWGGPTMFASAYADGYVRVYDILNGERPIAVFKSDNNFYCSPIVRVGWSKNNPRYLATITEGSSELVVIDLRWPDLPLAKLHHRASVKNVAWAPHSPSQLCTSGDGQAQIWDISAGLLLSARPFQPVLNYTTELEAEQLQWSSAQHDLIAVTCSNRLQILTLPGSFFR